MPHEIAHEWWGHKAGFGSGRDQWISETFAEFSAALYLEFREAQKKGDLNSTQQYEFQKKDEWMRRRNAHKQDRTAPLWLGGRMGGGEWQSTAYARGPMIMDMLRREFGKEVVVKAMYTFVEWIDSNHALHGGAAITEDWQTILEQVTGRGFEDFVNSFYKGNAVLPEYGKPSKRETKLEEARPPAGTN
jgi:aminopeptidase N